MKRCFKQGIALNNAALNTVAIGLAALYAFAPLFAQQPQSAPGEVQSPEQQTISALLRRLAEDETRIQTLENRLTALLPAAPPATTAASLEHAHELAAAPTDPAERKPAVGGNANSTADSSLASAMAQMTAGDHDHAMEIPGGPVLKFRGFTDMGFGAGKDSNHLVFPLGVPAHSTFTLGEFDLFMSSKISDHLSFASELVVGAGPDNSWGLDIERIQLTYRANPYFEVSGGRYHTAIGYYNTMFHHGTWFQTATGRPFMYLFEDSGGLLPVHNVGITATGLVPGTGKLGLHWIAEVGNGRTSNANAYTVQNFVADKNRKSVNFAAYVRPEWASGLQAGGSIYKDTLYPNAVTPVRQTVASAYAVFSDLNWELLNEGVLLRNASGFDHRVYNTPMMYTQVSRRFGAYRPYVRYQYVNASSGDPVNAFKGLYMGPSAGVRYDVSDFAAIKFQYNRLNQTGVAALNGLETQLAFTF
jgi:hypothetical protein